MLLNNKVEPFLGPKAYSESEALASFLRHRGARADQLCLFSRTSLINEVKSDGATVLGTFKLDSR